MVCHLSVRPNGECEFCVAEVLVGTEQKGTVLPHHVQECFSVLLGVELGKEKRRHVVVESWYPIGEHALGRRSPVKAESTWRVRHLVPLSFLKFLPRPRRVGLLVARHGALDHRLRASRRLVVGDFLDSLNLGSRSVNLGGTKCVGCSTGLLVHRGNLGGVCHKVKDDTIVVRILHVGSNDTIRDLGSVLGRIDHPAMVHVVRTVVCVFCSTHHVTFGVKRLLVTFLPLFIGRPRWAT
mmetsp:Transcript_11436/g.29197  ORF Transcript_11436/g.29197 Transcript_11436/m.29197 type:complete len:238 (+) Transcript_11436:2258-2971(+)